MDQDKHQKNLQNIKKKDKNQIKINKFFDYESDEFIILIMI